MFSCSYLFQNLTGSHIYYWSPADEVQAGPQGTKKKILLPAHSMHELKVMHNSCCMSVLQHAPLVHRLYVVGDMSDMICLMAQCAGPLGE